MEPESDYERVRKILEQQFLEAVQRRDFASFRFEDMDKDTPSGLPYPGSPQRVSNASEEYSDALQELSRTLKRLTDFREHRIVPEDLKPHG